MPDGVGAELLLVAARRLERLAGLGVLAPGVSDVGYFGVNRPTAGSLLRR
jgi:hypothetical protein